MVDKQDNDDKQHLDYYIPSKNKIFSFELEHGVQVVPIKMIDKRIPEKVGDNYDFDFDDIEEIILKEMEKNRIEDKVQKILLSLQSLDTENQGFSVPQTSEEKQKVRGGKDYLIGTVFISKMGLIKIQIDLSEMRVVEFEKKNILDFFKRIK